MQEVRARGFEAVMLASRLLQRARLADPLAGLWEAADIQWWWRSPRRSDDVDKLFWIDDRGPVAGVLVTSWTDDSWQCDPLVLPATPDADAEAVWTRAVQHAATLAPEGFTVPVSDDDARLRRLAEHSGLLAGHRDSTGWLAADDRPALRPLPYGLRLVDRGDRPDAAHPMQTRSGEEVARRLGQCPLYDPGLDLAVEAADGQVAGYALCWFDPTTAVGLVEPVRVEDAFQRRGLAGAMLSAGIDRLVVRGAQRIKVSWETEAAGALYQGLGFIPTSTATWYTAAP